LAAADSDGNNLVNTDDARPGSSADFSIQPPGAKRSAFRGDIEGLRAVAVTCVVLWHAGASWLPGGFVGVDVFFVISGFLITGLLVAEIEQRESISLLDFYARRARRILPAVAVVLTTVSVLTITVLPKIDWRSIGADIIASATFVVNWRFASQSVNYLAGNAVANSPVQHFWSLAVEEQFYLVWPCLLLLITLWGRRRPARMRTYLLAGMLLVFVPSLIWSIHLTHSDPAQAYFVTTTRLWELALGGGVAIAGAVFLRCTRAVGTVLSWSGTAAILLAAVALHGSDPYPGYRALLPTVGTAMVIAFTPAAGESGPVRILGLPPMRQVGKWSYSIYLWHWPLLVVARSRWGSLSFGASMLVVAVSVVLSALTFRYVEDPIRRRPTLSRRPARALGLGLACSLTALFGGVEVVHAAGPAAPPAQAATGPIGTINNAEGRHRAVGAEVLGNHPLGNPVGAPVNRVASITPNPTVARGDVPSVYADGCHDSPTQTAPSHCVYGDTTSKVEIAIVGDSHAAEWVPALQQIATSRHWKLLTYTKSGCHFATTPLLYLGTPDTSCPTWNSNVVAALTTGQRPNLVLTSQLTYDETPADTSALVRGMHADWAPLLADGIPIVEIRDTPFPPFDVAECASAHTTHLDRCSFPRSIALGHHGASQVEAVANTPNAHLIDLNDAICPTTDCAAVIGGVLVYRDASHLTATYSETLAPRLDRDIASYVTGGH
jgi:peptidoglycan/LPS O-acetylase OafA/YrhL